MPVTLIEVYSRAANRSSHKFTAVSKKKFFWSVFYYLFETTDVQSYCGYFLAICQLCLFF